VRQLRVALLTVNSVGALILFGMRPRALADAWSALQRLLGS
jgi:hypothetical protein